MARISHNVSLTHEAIGRSPYDAYLANTEKNEPLPPQLAAVAVVSEAVSESQQPLTTLSESISLVATLSNDLKSRLSPAEALAASAGTDAFQKMLVATLTRSSAHGSGEAAMTSSVADTKKAITDAARSFVDTTLAARKQVASYGSRLVADGTSIVVPAYSSTVNAFLRSAAESDAEFQVFFVGDPTAPSHAKQQRLDLIDYLRSSEVGVTEMDLNSIAQLLQSEPPKLTSTAQCFRSSQTYVLTGAAALLASGGALTSTGTHCVAAVAKAYGVAVLVAAESTKCVKELGVRSVRIHSDSSASGTPLGVLPAKFITSFVTEAGPLNSAAIAEEALKKWS